MPGPSARRLKGKRISTASDSDSGYSESESENRNSCTALQCARVVLAEGRVQPVLGNNRPCMPDPLHIFTPFSQQKKTLHQKKKKNERKKETRKTPTLKTLQNIRKSFDNLAIRDAPSHARDERNALWPGEMGEESPGVIP
jgi:hypothetical protein